MCRAPYLRPCLPDKASHVCAARATVSSVFSHLCCKHRARRAVLWHGSAPGLPLPGALITHLGRPQPPCEAACQESGSQKYCERHNLLFHITSEKVPTRTDSTQSWGLKEQMLAEPFKARPYAGWKGTGGG